MNSNFESLKKSVENRILVCKFQKNVDYRFNTKLIVEYLSISKKQNYIICGYNKNGNIVKTYSMSESQIVNLINETEVGHPNNTIKYYLI